jgi:hypothetical protein
MASSAYRSSSPQPPPGRKHARDLRWCPFKEGDPKLNYLRQSQDDYTLEDSFHAVCHDPLGLGIAERVGYDEAQRRKAAGLPSLKEELGAWLSAGCPLEMEDGSISRSGGGDTILTTPAGAGGDVVPGSWWAKPAPEPEEDEEDLFVPQEVGPLLEAIEMWQLGERDRQARDTVRPPFQEPQPKSPSRSASPPAPAAAKKRVAVPLQIKTASFEPLPKPQAQPLTEIMRQEAASSYKPPSRSQPPPPLSWSQRAAKSAEPNVRFQSPQATLNLAAYLSNI